MVSREETPLPMPSDSPPIYHPVPQAPVSAGPLSPLDEDDFNLENSILLEPPGPLHESGHHLPVPRLTLWILFMLGSAVLLPWNALITAMPYFQSRLEGSPLKTPFGSYLSVSFAASNLLFLAHATATSKQSSPSARIRSTMLGLALLTLLLTVSTFVPSSSGIFFAFVLLEGIAQSGLGSYLQCSVIAVASRYGPDGVQVTLSGQAAVAVVVSGIQVVSAFGSIWASNERPSIHAADNAAARSAAAFFTISALFLLVTTAAYAWLVRTPAYRTITATLETSNYDVDPHEATHLMSGVPIPPDDDFQGDHHTRLVQVAKANILYEIAVAGVFTVTLAVFPAITATVDPVSNMHPLLFMAFHFFLFNIGDFLGRQLCTYPRFLIWSDKKLLFLSTLRLIFVPIFLLCNIQGTQGTPTINSDFLFLFILCLFGLSNGYISTLSMIAASSVKHNPNLKGRHDNVDIAATVASFCLVGGLAIGSFASFAVRSAFCQCNPFATSAGILP